MTMQLKVKLIGAAFALTSLGSWAAQAEDVRSVAPALEKYKQERLLGEVWKQPGLSARDRSIVTVAVLVARNHTLEIPYYVNFALDSGVKPAEISEIITHLAFYSGWGNAMSAVAATKDVFAKRGIGADRLPLDETAEKARASQVGQQFGNVSPSVVQYTTEILFRDLWLRPDLAPRDRSLVTVSALVASGQVAQIPYHLNRAMDNGVTRAQASEVLTHLAFYVGWPSVFSALRWLRTSSRSAPGNGRFGRPKEIADAVLWLCSPYASLVIGHALVVDGRYTVR